MPHAGWFVGGGVLAVLLGVASASPVISRPFLLAARAAYARGFGSIGNLAGQNSLRNPRRTTATASALMIGLTLACTMAIVGDSAKATVDKSVAENFVGDYVVSNVFGGAFSPPASPTGWSGSTGSATSSASASASAAATATPGRRAPPTRATLAALGLSMPRGTAADLRDGTVLLED